MPLLMALSPKVAARKLCLLAQSPSLSQFHRRELFLELTLLLHLFAQARPTQLTTRRHCPETFRNHPTCPVYPFTRVNALQMLITTATLPRHCHTICSAAGRNIVPYQRSATSLAILRPVEHGFSPVLQTIPIFRGVRTVQWKHMTISDPTFFVRLHVDILVCNSSSILTDFLVILHSMHRSFCDQLLIMSTAFYYKYILSETAEF